MSERETVTSEVEILDPLYAKQQQDVANMRASLLACTTNSRSAQTAIQRITAMRFYHQLSRIIKYTEMMDKIEAKMYSAIDSSLEKMNSDSPSTWIQLLSIQEKLQKNMIESQKLLDPYLKMNLTFTSIPPEIDSDNESVSFGAMMIDQESRDKLRSSAQALLAAIESSDLETSLDSESTSDEEVERGDT